MGDPIDPDPKGSGGVKSADAAGENRAGAGEEHRQDEGRGEGGNNGHGGGRGEGVDAPKTASKGINPVQHSE